MRLTYKTYAESAVKQKRKVITLRLPRIGLMLNAIPQSKRISSIANIASIFAKDITLD